jgi:hypothetical protein
MILMEQLQMQLLEDKVNIILMMMALHQAV